MPEVRMPSRGADGEAGTLARWLIHPGDRVKRGQIVAVVETQKGAIEVETVEEGVVGELLVNEGARVPVGTVLATIGAPAAPSTGGGAGAQKPVGAGVPGAPPVPVAAGVPGAPSVPVGAGLPGAPSVPVGAGLPGAPSVPVGAGVPPALSAWPARALSGEPPVRSSPSARVAARTLGVDLAAVRGTGPGGAVRRADVERAAAGAPSHARPPPSAPAAEGPRPSAGAPSPAAPRAEGPRPSAVDPAAMRGAIAAAMARSKREIPHYHLAQTIDLRRALAWLAERNAGVGIAERLVPAVLLLRAVAKAAKEVPEVNGTWVDGAFRPAAAVHPGVAISLSAGGLVAPALHDADRGSLDELMARLGDLVTRAQAGRLRASELTDPTLTVTDLGDRGVDEIVGVIFPPQVALVGFGRVREAPVAIDGMLAVRPVVRATLAADHRASDGHRGGLFLARVDALLQSPASL